MSHSISDALITGKCASGVENTGVQLFADDMLATDFLTKQTYAVIHDIRRIVFQMLGMDHLVLFIDACIKLRLPNETQTEAAKVRLLLYFAIECGLDLGPTARHLTLFHLYLQGVDPFELRDISLYSVEHRVMSTAAVLTRMRTHKKHIDGTILSTVLASTSLVTDPIFDGCGTIVHDSTRLCSLDSGSAVWFEILDIMFTYHQRTHPTFTSLHILSMCLHASRTYPIMTQLVCANVWDDRRRMLPYLLRKPDLNDGSIIYSFFYRADYIDHIIACAAICKDHPNWPQMCVRVITVCAAHKDFVTNVSRLPGMNVESKADIAAYVIANVKSSDVRSLSVDLMQLVVNYSAFDTPSSIDRVLTWITSCTRPSDSSKVMCLFAYRLFQMRADAERAAIYERYRAVYPDQQYHSEIIYYLMHGEDAFGTYDRETKCNLHLVHDMLVLVLDNRAIAYIIDATNARAGIYLEHNAGWFTVLCEFRLHFDLLLILLKRHPFDADKCGILDTIKASDCYSDDDFRVALEYMQPDPLPCS